MSSINRYTDLQLHYGPKFNQLNVTHPSVISTVNDVTGIGVSDGDRYIVGSSPTDDFLLANTNDIAYYDGTIGEWVFTTPYVGQELIDRDSKTLKRYNGTEWINVFTFVSPSGTSDINISGNAGSASRWETTRSIRIENGGWAGPVAIDGTSNILLQLGDLDMSYATRGILDIARGGTGRDDNKTVGLINPIQIQLSNGLSGNTESTDLSGGNNVVINVTAIDADFINSGNIGVKRGGTGTNVLNGILKGNGTNAVTTAVPGTDYVIPSGNITGNATSADKFSSNKTIAVVGDMSGTVSTNFSDDTVITTAYAGTVPVKRGGTGQISLTANKLLKGNGTDAVTYAVPAVDYVTPSGDTTGNAGSADKLSSSRNITLTGAVIGDIKTTLAENVTIATTYNGIAPVSTGGTGRSTLTGILKGNGSSAILSAQSGVDYVIPSGSITGNAGSADKLSTERLVTLNGDITGSVKTQLKDNSTIINTSYMNIVPVVKGGTGLASLTDNKLLKGNGTNPIDYAIPGTDYVTPSGNTTGNAGSADKFSSARSVIINGAVVGSASSVFSTSSQPTITTTYNNIVPISKGGTNADNTVDAVNNIGAAFAIHKHVKSDITDFPTTMYAAGGWADTAKKLDHKVTVSVSGAAEGSASSIDFAGTTGFNIGVVSLDASKLKTTTIVPRACLGSTTSRQTYDNNITGNASTSNNFSSSKTIGLSGAVTGSISTTFASSPTITTTYNDVVPISKGGTNADNTVDAVRNIGAAYASHTHAQSDITGLADALARVVPAGAFSWFCGSTAPSGYLECNGAAISRTTYAKLFAAIGTTYGSGNGSTTFNIPDTRGMFVRGWNHGKFIGSESYPADKLDGYDRAIGSTQLAGSPFHSHHYSGTVSAAGDHNHNGSITTSNGNHAHTVSISTNGDHIHNVAARTGTNGDHTHGYWDVFFSEMPNYNKWGLSQVSVPYNFGSKGGYDNDDVGFQMARTTDPAGGHWHDVSGTAQSAGYHSHIGTCVDSGAHTHNLNMVYSGNHTHTFSGSVTTIDFDSATEAYLTTTRIDNRPMNIAFMGIIKY